jgi:hypothetical protein
VVPAEVPAQRARPSSRCIRDHTGGTFGGTLRDKDEEIRVRTGKFGFQPRLGHGAASGVLCRPYVDNKGFILAPQSGHVSNFCGLRHGLLERSNRSNCF